MKLQWVSTSNRMAKGLPARLLLIMSKGLFDVADWKGGGCMGHWRCCWRRMPAQYQAIAMSAICAEVAPCPQGHPCAAVPRAANLPMIQSCRSPSCRPTSLCFGIVFEAHNLRRFSYGPTVHQLLNFCPAATGVWYRDDWPQP